MKDIPAQYHRFMKTTMGDNIISFRVDQMYSDTVGELVQAQIGTEYIMRLQDVTTGVVLGGNVKNINTEEKFRRTMHALIGQIAGKRSVEKETVKDELKDWLILRKHIVKSTKELDIKSLAISCNILQKWLND